MSKRIAFNITAAVPEAYKLQWAERLRWRAEGHDFRGNTYYLTASDVEAQVRTFAGEELEGKAWGSTGAAYGSLAGMGVRLGGDVFGAVRDWLLAEVRAGRLESHNFGKGHISGMRFRPAGEPLAECEVKTVADKARRQTTPRPVHSRRSPNSWSPLCSKPRTSFGRGVNPGRGPRVTSKAEDVTCPRCKKLTAAAPAPVATEVL